MLNSIIKKVIVLFITILFIIPNLYVYANENFNINKKASLSIKHFYNNKPIKNTIFKIYKVGNISGDEKITPSNEFINYDINVESADTIESYVYKNKIKPYKELETKENGIVTFDNLELGVYLVTGNTSVINNASIKTNAFLVELPSKDKVSGKYLYDVEAKTKNNEITESNIDFEVEKIWINDENTSNKPKSIEIELFKESKLYDTITLNENNNWKYVWNNLESKYNWTVVEKNVPKHYTVSYEKYSKLVKIKNTYKKNSTTVKPPNTNLPQTGNTWIIAQCIALVGLVCISAGCIIKRKNE